MSTFFIIYEPSYSKLSSREHIRIILGVLLFLINPFIATISLVISLFFISRIRLSGYLSFVTIIIAFFFSIINMTKIPENDLLYHGQQYLLAGDFSYLIYLLYIGKEPIYYTFNYIIYSISNGGIKVWIFSYSFISFYLFFKSINIFYRKNRANSYQIALALVLAAFFPQLFSLSAHLIRQFIAASLFIYFTVDKIFYKNNKWWLLIAGIFTHTSILILFLLSYLPWLGDLKKHFSKNLLLIIALTSYQVISSIMLSYLGGIIPFVTYILKRASKDTTFQLGEFSIMNYVMMVIMVGIVLFFLAHKSGMKNSWKKYSQKSYQKYRHFYSIMIYFSVFILMNINQSELSNRLFFYLFFFFPFTVPLLFKKKSTINKISSLTIALFFIFYFLYRLPNGVWTYAPLQEIITNNLYDYFVAQDYIRLGL